MLRDRVYETSNSGGTGNFLLDGAATGYRTYASTFASGTAYYLIVNRTNPAEWEAGTFTINGATLARVAANVISGSSGAGVLVNFGAGLKDVINTLPASVLNSMLPSAILTTPRSTVYNDTRVVNCSGSIPNGNCNGNTQWDMPNGNWWTWTGVSGISRYNPGYDFAGGTTSVNQALTQVNQQIWLTDALSQVQVAYDVRARTWRNCNCGTLNCFTNCNCNCDCNCYCGDGGDGGGN